MAPWSAPSRATPVASDSGDLLERVRAGGLLAPGRARARPALRRARLGLPARRRRAASPARRRARAALQLRPARGGRRRRGRTARALCERSASRSHVHRPRGARRGNLQAWARDERYAAAAGSRRTATSPPGTPPPTRSRPCSTGSRRRPAAARCSAWPRAKGALVRPLLGVTVATRPPRTARRAAWRGARTPPTPAPRSRAAASAHELLPALRAIHPAAEANVLRTLELLRDEAAVLDAAVDEALEAAGDPPARDALRALPAPLRRLALQRLADRAAGPDAPPRSATARPRSWGWGGRRARRRRRAARRDPRRARCGSDRAADRRRRIRRAHAS